MAIAHVQTFQATPTQYNTVLTIAETPATTPTAGNMIAVGIYIYKITGAPAITSITDVALNTYQSAKEQVGFSGDSNKVRAAIWYAKNIATSVNDTVTVTLGATVDGSITLSEYSGVDTTNALDSNSNSGQGSSTTPSTGAATATNSGSLYLALMADKGSGVQTLTPPGGSWTQRAENESSTAVPLNLIELIGSGSQTGSWTISITDQWAAVLAIFNPASGVAQVYQAPMSLMGVGL